MAREYPSYHIYKDNRGEWRWTYEARNGRTIGVSSEGYNNYDDARRSVEIMQESSTSKVYHTK